jgi:hypothetical protein
MLTVHAAGLRQRALALLAKSADGRTAAILLARGFTRDLLAAFLRDGLATTIAARAGRTRLVEVVRIKITEAGRAVLSKPCDHSSSSVSGGSEAALIVSANPIMDKANGKAEDQCGFEEERRNLAMEIMMLSPPLPGCEQRARLILERKFTLNELQVLVQALRDGIDSIVKPKQSGRMHFQ